MYVNLVDVQVLKSKNILQLPIMGTNGHHSATTVLFKYVPVS